MAWNPDQGQPNDPNSAYGTPSNPYEAPQNPYSTPTENPYGTAQNPYGTPTENPYSTAQSAYGTPAENPYATPPYAAPGYGTPGYQASPGYGPIASAPLPLGEAIRNLPNQYIKVLTKPGAMTIAEEMGKASWNIVWVQLIALAIITAILGYLGSLITPLATGTTSSGTTNPIAMQSFLAGLSLSYIIIIPVFFFIGMGILYGLARAFSGQGRFLTQCYSFLLFDVPLRILAALVGLIPFAGGLIAFAISIYEIVLSIFAIMAVHRLSGGKATGVVLIPVGVLLLLACGLFVLFFALIFAALQHR